MRVLYLTNNPNLGSTARILQSWLILGRDQGIKGVVGAQHVGTLTEWLGNRGFDFQVNPMPWLDRRWPFSSLWSAWRLARWARRHRVDLIHCNEHNVYPFALLLRRFLKKPVVCHVRFAVDRIFCEWAFSGPSRQPDALLWTSRQQWTDCSKAVAGLIPQEKQHLVYLGLSLQEFGTLAHGRDETRAKWRLKPEEIAVGTASAMKPIKRLEEFITLIARVAAKNDKVVGVLAGDAPAGEEAYRNHLVRKIEETGLGRRFIWLGNQEPIEPFYHAIDLFVSTSEYETFGNSVCEAMACQRPVVAYRGGSVHEILGDAGIVVETGDLEKAIDEVNRLVQNPEERTTMGQRGKNRVAICFDPSKSFAELKHIYESLCQVKGSRPAATNHSACC